MTEDRFEDALRASLRAHADRAPLDGDVVARTLAATRHEPAGAPARRRRDWHNWGLPVLAAAAVAAVAAVGVVVAVQQGSHHESAPGPVGGTHSSAPSTTSAPTRPVAPPPTVTRTVTAPATTSRTSSSTPTRLQNVRVRDLTFASADHGWALGSADCLSGSGRCTAVLRTTDGHTWHGIPGGTFKVPGVSGCVGSCVQHLRFATDSVGYAYGPDELFMTTDGGASWQRQGNLGADALETSDGNVILVRTANTDQPLFERAPIGTSQWTPIGSPSATSLPAGAAAARISLARNGHDAYLLFSGDAAKDRQPSVLYRSSNDGRSWVKAGNPCPRIGTGYFRSALAVGTGADGTAAIACDIETPGGASAGLTVTATNAGGTFVQPPNGGKLPPADLLAVAGRDVQIVATADGVYRSDDRGDSWTRVSQVSGTVIFVGFEDGQTGRIVTDGGRSTYTTQDAGRTWSKAVLS